MLAFNVILLGLLVVAIPCLAWVVFQLHRLRDMGKWKWRVLLAFTFIAAISNLSSFLNCLAYFIAGQEMVEARVAGAVLGVLAWTVIYWRKPLKVLLKEGF